MSLSFAQLPDAALSEFTNVIVTSLTDNPNYPTSIVPLPDLTTAGTTFRNAVLAAAQGGFQFTAAKDAAQEALIPLPQQQASYV